MEARHLHRRTAETAATELTPTTILASLRARTRAQAPEGQHESRLEARGWVRGLEGPYHHNPPRCHTTTSHTGMGRTPGSNHATLCHGRKALPPVASSAHGGRRESNGV